MATSDKINESRATLATVWPPLRRRHRFSDLRRPGRRRAGVVGGGRPRRLPRATGAGQTSGEGRRPGRRPAATEMRADEGRSRGAALGLKITPAIDPRFSDDSARDSAQALVELRLVAPLPRGRLVAMRARELSAETLVQRDGLRPVYARSLSWAEALAGTATSGPKTPLRCSSVKRPWMIL